MTEKTIGYARTANSHGNITPQIEALKAAGCTEIYTDEAISGHYLDRPGLHKARAALAAGDTFKVCTMDRLSRSLDDLHTFVSGLMGDGIKFDTVTRPDEGRYIRDLVNYGVSRVFDPQADMPILHKLAYRIGAFFIRISERGAPSL